MSSSQQTLKILVVEDDEDDFLLINDYIKELPAWKCEVKWVYRFEEAVEELAVQYPHDLFFRLPSGRKERYRPDQGKPIQEQQYPGDPAYRPRQLRDRY
jgi:hypothetical protein